MLERGKGRSNNKVYLEKIVYTFKGSNSVEKYILSPLTIGSKVNEKNSLHRRSIPLLTRGSRHSRVNSMSQNLSPF